VNLIVIALGGNALSRKGETLEAEAQKSNIEKAASLIAEIAAERKVVVTHGNGPQVGLLALQAYAYKAISPYPLDVLGAESEGMIGYLLEQELTNCLRQTRVATLLTQVVVDSEDPAFDAPTKPIGPVYAELDAQRLSENLNWPMANAGEGFRRVVASPIPQRILEIGIIRLLVEADVLVICAGGGGIPVTISESGLVEGVEAVIDKDRSAALLATEIGASELLILTDIDAVYSDWGTPRSRSIKVASPDQLQKYSFDNGSMGPKVYSACDFAATGGIARIGALEDALSVLNGDAGTTVSQGSNILELYDT
jgi:carbamate kinase